MFAHFLLLAAIASTDAPTASTSASDQEAPVGKLVGSKIVDSHGAHDRSVRIPKPWKQIDPTALVVINRLVWEVQMVVQGIVEKDGTISSIEPVHCKVTSGDRPLPNAESAETCTSAFEVSKAAYSQWRYYPATRDGVPVRVYVTQQFYVKCNR